MPSRTAHHATGGRHRAVGQLLVPAALQEILHLEAQPGREGRQGDLALEDRHRITDGATEAPRVGHRDEGAERGTTLLPPSEMVTVAQPLTVPDPHAARDRAGRPSEHRVPGVEDDHVPAELGAHRGQQLLPQARGLVTMGKERHLATSHSVTSRPVNHPATSRARRASSTLRWP